MVIKKEVAEGFLKKYHKELAENNIDSSSRAAYEGNKVLKDYQSITFRTDCLPVYSNIEFMIAHRIAKENKVKLGTRDFSRGEDEPADERKIFSVECQKEEDIEEGINNIIKAQTLFNNKVDKIVEFALSL